MEEKKTKKKGRYRRSRKGIGGRPKQYRDDFPEQAKKLCILGATNTQLAIFFGVGETTIERWFKDHPEFWQAVKEGKQKQDMEVASALLQRAMGYEAVEEQAIKVKQVEYDPSTGKKVNEIERVEVVNVTKVYPPDTGAAKYWLSVRQRDYWVEPKTLDKDTSDTSDLVKLESGGQDKGDSKASPEVQDDRLERLAETYKLAQKQLAKEKGLPDESGDS